VSGVTQSEGSVVDALATGRQVVVLSCQVLQDMLQSLLPPGLAGQVIFMDYGLHRVPQKMTRALQEVLDGIEQPSLVLLGYGLCGNGLRGLRSGRHVLVAPRVDDCIALLLGSHRAYMREFEAVPGTYYLCKGWLESGSNPLQEYQEYEARYGPQEAMWLVDQQYGNYERLVLVAHSQADLEAYRPQALEVARFCERWGMRYEERLGSDAYVRRLIEAAASPERAGDDFVVVPPGGEVRQDDFRR
jgi:hypothetical protein